VCWAAGRAQPAPHDVEHDLGVRRVAFPGAVLAAHGTDAGRVSDTVAFMTIGFTVEAEIQGGDRCDVSRIHALLRGDVIPIQDPLKRLLAELRARIDADGDATIFPEDLDLLVAAIGDEA
jgi:hypothetical protein